MATYVTRNFYRDEIIFNEGTKGDVAYILIKGIIQIYTNRKNKKIVLATLEPTAVFGEMALLSCERSRSATAQALEISEVIIIDKETFDRFLGECPQLISALLVTFTKRLKDANRRVASKGDLFTAMAYILNLSVAGGFPELPYDEIVDNLSKALAVDGFQVEEQLALMSQYHLINITDSIDRDGRKVVLPSRISRNAFIVEAKKVYQKLMPVFEDSECR
jgi:hypothetical protein